MNAVEAYDALMLDYAAGALTPARRLLVETYLQLRPAAGAIVTALDAAGGALLEEIEPADTAALPLTGAPWPAPAPDHRGRSAMVEAHALIEAASRQPDNLSWRWRAPGLRELRLPCPGASLIRLQGGRALAAHGHTDEELTLVLRGGYSDSAGHYEVGDIAFADAGFDHSPLVPVGREDCVCLVAMDGSLRFHGMIARVTARLLS